MDITLGNRNEYSKRFNFVRGDDGDVSFDDSEAHAVMTSVVERKRSYWADATHGSELFELRNLTSRTPSQAEAVDITWNTPSGMPGSATAGV
jgi:phage gp46-like protein